MTTAPVPGAALDWRDFRHWHRDPAPCVLCNGLTHLRSENGSPVHKVCAERWLTEHPAASHAA